MKFKKNGFPWNTRKFILEEKYKWDTGNKGIFYFSPDLKLIVYDGVWNIPPKTSWDGVTNFWDGPQDKDHKNYSTTWEATLIHDLGCEYWNTDPTFPYSRFRIDFFFFKKLLKCKTKIIKYFLSYVYYIVVSIYTIWLYFKNHCLKL